MFCLKVFCLKVTDESMKNFILNKIHSEQFAPGFFALITNPFYHARSALRRELGELGKSLTGRVIDVGCGRKPYRDLIPAVEYVGLELNTPLARERDVADFYYDGKEFPFVDSSFDSMLCSQVFEHVFHPEAFLGEAERVLKPGGKLLLTVPFVWDEHEQPFDFARYSSFGLRSLLERHGFVVVEHKKSLNDARVLFQMMACFVQKTILPKNKKWALLLSPILIAPINLLGIFFGKISPLNSDLYLDNIVLAEKLA